MRTVHWAMAGMLVLSPPASLAQDAFDACHVFTQGEAEKAMGTAAAPEDHPKAPKRPRLSLSCAYTGFKDGKAVEARAQFRIARNDAESQRAFDEARLQLQTKPMIISGAEAFWSGKTGQMHLRKGRTWLTLTVGPAAINEREIEPVRRLAEALVKKL